MDSKLLNPRAVLNSWSRQQTSGWKYESILTLVLYLHIKCEALRHSTVLFFNPVLVRIM